MTAKTGHIEIEEAKIGRPIKPVAEVNEHLDSIRAFVRDALPHSRPASIALTHLDNCVLWIEQALRQEHYDE